MPLLHAFIAVSLIATLDARTAAQDEKPNVGASTAGHADPMASFARLVGGEWRATYRSGTSFFHTWQWGPGRHSLRRTTVGTAADGKPWRALLVLYWDPSRKQVRLLVLEPVARGVGEGTIRFEGETAEAVYDLDQTRGRRNLTLRWAFDGPDTIHETLSERTGPGVLTPLVTVDQVRSRTPAAPRPPTDRETARPSGRLGALAPLVGRSWEARGRATSGDAVHLRSTLAWAPLADVIHARVLAPRKEGGPTHLLDAYVYYHTGTGAVRCLALSDRGGVYEGELAVLDGGALQLDLKGHAGDQGVAHLVRLDFEKDGTVRQRVWALDGAGRTLTLDVHHRESGSKND